MPSHGVLLAQAMRKLNLKSPPLPPKSILSFLGDNSSEDDDLAGVTRSPSRVPADVGKGFLAVYVGRDDNELQRFVIPVNYLKLKVFMILLRRAEEEFGFCNSGAIRIPCEKVLFEHLLWLLNGDDYSAVQSLEMEELLRFYSSDEKERDGHRL